mmetsp:Transcript_23123/g.46155  ORF Transcript_23123/g.46155 Transcript_23123/m.46155 type:complete len:254 (+) Transcript_23123:1601-2362(+)
MQNFVQYGIRVQIKSFAVCVQSVIVHILLFSIADLISMVPFLQNLIFLILLRTTGLTTPITSSTRIFRCILATRMHLQIMVDGHPAVSMIQALDFPETVAQQDPGVVTGTPSNENPTNLMLDFLLKQKVVIHQLLFLHPPQNLPGSLFPCHHFHQASHQRKYSINMFPTKEAVLMVNRYRILKNALMQGCLLVQMLDKDLQEPLLEPGVIRHLVVSYNPSIIRKRVFMLYIFALQMEIMEVLLMLIMYQSVKL